MPWIVGYLGLVLGSFANVVIHRLPRDKSVVSPPSACPRCNSRVRWVDNIPVISFLLLRGRCRSCKESISIRYPIIELLMAALFLLCYARFGANALLFARDLPLMFLAVVITFIDLDHRIIPDELSYGGLALGLATAYWTADLGLFSSILGAALGFSMFFALAWVYEWRTGKQGLGGGDIKLLAMIGAFVGPLGVFHTILISSVLGSVIGIALAIAQKRSSLMGVAIPYGPFLMIGALYYYFLGEVPWFQFMTPM